MLHILCIHSFMSYFFYSIQNIFYFFFETKTLPDMKNNINNFKQIPSFFYIIVIIIIEQCIYKLHKIHKCVCEELKRNIKIACNAYSQSVLCFNNNMLKFGLTSSSSSSFLHVLYAFRLYFSGTIYIKYIGKMKKAQYAVIYIHV